MKPLREWESRKLYTVNCGRPKSQNKMCVLWLFPHVFQENMFEKKYIVQLYKACLTKRRDVWEVITNKSLKNPTKQKASSDEICNQKQALTEIMISSLFAKDGINQTNVALSPLDIYYMFSPATISFVLFFLEMYVSSIIPVLELPNEDHRRLV